MSGQDDEKASGVDYSKREAEQAAAREQAGALSGGVAPAIGISYQATVGGGTLVFQTHVDAATDRAGLDALTDKFIAVAERQAAKVLLVELRKNRKVQADQLQRMREDRTRIEQSAAPQEGRRNPNRVAQDQLEKHRQQADANEKRFGEILKDLDDQIAECEATIKGG